MVNMIKFNDHFWIYVGEVEGNGTKDVKKRAREKYDIPEKVPLHIDWKKRNPEGSRFEARYLVYKQLPKPKKIKPKKFNRASQIDFVLDGD